MLSVFEIDVFYGEVQVIHGLSIEIKKGTTTALLGSNGAGKSTVLRTLSGILRPEKGQVLLGNNRLDKIEPSTIVTKGIAHVPEGRRLFSQMSVEENLIMGAFEKKLWANRKDNLQYIYDLFPRLKERRMQEAGTLSGGEQQMVAIGRALMSKPKMLMLDEPSLGLAPKIVESIFELIQDLNKEGITILLVEQNAQIALEISDYSYVLENGRIALEGKAENLMDNIYVKQAYLGL
ncbi:ABC transporter ATP-binding protein [Sporosarcina jiandibaonis]|uniref:ABC transporter ATP-binding protein n=1 Tax=Sporosarcina jiandibaonis TaxID=2715535 RepID=UPI001553BAE9|nr:ABC transporter ATP-binding protein [Sporosarcina jiandibaonis]